MRIDAATERSTRVGAGVQAVVDPEQLISSRFLHILLTLCCLLDSHVSEVRCECVTLPQPGL